MMRSPLLALLLAFALSSSACGQAVSSDDSAERKARILANLVHEFPQLGQHRVEVGTIEPSGVAGLDEGEFTINGQQTQRFLLTEDDTRLYLLAGPPVDVSRSADELAGAQAEREAAAASEARERANALDEIADELPMRGDPDAPVTIVEFSDFQCPYCARAYNTVEQVLGARDDVRLVYLHYPLPNHPWARPAAVASLCAAQQDDDAFWALHDGYFENQRAMTEANVLDKSRAFLAGHDLDLDAWNTCASDTSSEAHQRAVAELERDMALAQRYGVTGTPGFFINGRFLNGAQPLEAFQSVIEEAKQDS